MDDVVIYTKSYCGYCAMAKALLRRKKVDFAEIDVTSDFGLQQQMIALAGRRTVPQIFVGGTPVGGWDDLAALDRSGKLDELLKRPARATAA